jgi:type IV secretory pathway TraG/TraD family ATPase VirD4
MGVRNRLSGTLSIQNRFNQLNAAWRWWSRGIVPITGAVYAAGMYYVFVKEYNLETMGFYFKFLLENKYHIAEKINQHIEHGNAITHDLYVALAAATSTTKMVLNFTKNGGTSQELAELIQNIGRDIYHINLVGIATMVGLGLMAFTWARLEAKRQTEDKIIRGAKLFSATMLNKLQRKIYEKGSIKIGKIVIGRKLEALSTVLVGKPQQGKTQVFNSILTEIQRRGQQAICFCAKAEDFITTHYRPEVDLIFCPGADLRSFGWNLASDITSVEDFAVIAGVLAPVNPQDKNPMWQKGEFMVIKALLRHWYLCTDKSNKELARIAKMSQEQMSEILKDTPECEEAYGLIWDIKSQTCRSFYITCLCDLQPLQLLGRIEGTFSINEWYATGKNTIYLPCSAKLEASLAPLYALFLEMCAVSHMALPQDRNRRVWYLLDELPNIAKVNKLSSMMNVGPSFGVACVLGTQSIGLIDQRYTEEGRRSILNACATTIIFCVEDGKTATELAERIGQDEREKAKESLNTASAESRDGVSVMAELKKDYLVNADELRNLTPLNGYIRVAGLGTAKLKIKYVPYPALNPPFVQNPAFSLEATVREHADIQAAAVKAKERYMLGLVDNNKEKNQENTKNNSNPSSQIESENEQRQAEEQAMQMQFNSGSDDGLEV